MTDQVDSARSARHDFLLVSRVVGESHAAGQAGRRIGQRPPVQEE